MQYQPQGKHVIIDLHGCNKENLDDLILIKSALISACSISNNKLLNLLMYKFEPQGVTGILLLEESHISIHTYPEHQSCFIDIFTCGEKTTPELAVDFFEKIFKSKSKEIKTLKRGLKYFGGKPNGTRNKRT